MQIQKLKNNHMKPDGYVFESWFFKTKEQFADSEFNKGNEPIPVYFQSQQPKEADAWISVEDRLPNWSSGNLFSENILGYGNERIEVGSLFKQYNGKYSLYHLRQENYINKVTYWQPLPLPPKNSQ